MNPQPIQDLAQKLAGAVPPGFGALRADLEKNFRVLLEAGLARMNLVTREEFDAQCAVLERTRAQLAALESQLAALESRAAPPSGAA
jgi:BMFP domain-containing protein YqiC